MLDPDNLKKVLEVFRTNVVRGAKRSLRQQKKVVSGNLLDSVKGSPVKVTENSLTFNIKMADYGTFQDKGVSGDKNQVQHTVHLPR
jgi:hypothetical protein